MPPWVFPGEVLTGLYATLGDARDVMSFIALAAQILVAAAIVLIAISHMHQRRRQIGEDLRDIHLSM